MGRRTLKIAIFATVTGLLNQTVLIDMHAESTSPGEPSVAISSPGVADDLVLDGILLKIDEPEFDSIESADGAESENGIASAEDTREKCQSFLDRLKNGFALEKSNRELTEDHRIQHRALEAANFAKYYDLRFQLLLSALSLPDARSTLDQLEANLNAGTWDVSFELRAMAVSTVARNGVLKSIAQIREWLAHRPDAENVKRWFIENVRASQVFQKWILSLEAPPKSSFRIQLNEWRRSRDAINELQIYRAIKFINRVLPSAKTDDGREIVKPAVTQAFGIMIDRYDSSRGALYFTSAVVTAMNFTRRAVLHAWGWFDMSLTEREKFMNVRSAQQRLTQEYARNPSDQEIAEATHLSISDVILFRKKPRPQYESEMGAKDADSPMKIEVAILDNPLEERTPDQRSQDTAAKVQEVIFKTLDHKTAKMIMEYWGIRGPKKTLQEIADVEHVTRAAISLRVKAAQEKLRIHFNSETIGTDADVEIAPVIEDILTEAMRYPEMRRFLMSLLLGKNFEIVRLRYGPEDMLPDQMVGRLKLPQGYIAAQLSQMEATLATNVFAIQAKLDEIKQAEARARFARRRLAR